AGCREGGRGLPAHARVLEVADALADACRRERVPALVGSLGEAGVGALLSVDREADPDAVLTPVSAAARQLLPAGDPVIGAGSPAASLAGARRSLLEAQQVAEAAAASPSAGRGRPYYRLADLRLRGLLHLLGGDAPLATVLEPELRPPAAPDPPRGP